MFPEKLFARNPWFHASCQGVPDVGDGHVVQAEKCFFEGEDAEQPVDNAPHGFDSALPPSPDLRGHQIHHRHPLLFQLIGHAEVEIRRIRENGERGLFLFRGRHQKLVFAPDAGQVFQHLQQAHHGEIFHLDDGFHARGTHLRAGTAKKLAIRPALPQHLSQFSGIVVA